MEQTKKNNTFANSIIAHYDAWILIIITNTYVASISLLRGKLISTENIKIPRKKMNQ